MSWIPDLGVSDGYVASLISGPGAVRLVAAGNPSIRAWSTWQGESYVSGLIIMAGALLGLGVVLAGRRVRDGNARPVRREAIDIESVLEEKYPNRTRDALDAEPGAAVAVAQTAPPEQPPADEPAPEEAWPEAKAAGAWIAPPTLDEAPWAPIPGEPGDDYPMGPPRRPARVEETPDGPALVASPYDALRRRRDRVAAQAELAFTQVHRLRTESLRRASQAEHNAELATTARVRAARMTRESRKYEAQGRVRSLAVPDASDAFHDVHRFRVEALRRAHEAAHGAEAVAQARERATRLLKEQRKIEAEMGRLSRGGVPSENL